MRHVGGGVANASDEKSKERDGFSLFFDLVFCMISRLLH